MVSAHTGMAEWRARWKENGGRASVPLPLLVAVCGLVAGVWLEATPMCCADVVTDKRQKIP